MAQINKPNTHFNPVLYTGNDTGQSITGVNFQPDLVWIKSRGTAERHVLNDVVRGVYQELRSNENAAESDRTSFGGLSAFNSDGFTIGVDDGYNDGSVNYCSWNWKAGGTAVSNTDGSITSSVSANTTSGISIGTFTGTGANATVGHGLGSVPKYLWVKRRDGAGDWMVYHVSKGNTAALFYNSTSAGATSSTYWQDTTPTSSVFSIGSNGNLNTSGESHSFVAFAEKKGFSKFGSYVGNGSVDGTFIYTGFRPSFFLVKSTGAAESWLMFDIERNTYNGIDGQVLRPDLANAEVSSSATKLEFLSNGFKWRSNDAGHNGSGSTYIYYAVAQNPLVGTNGVPTTAR